MVLHLWLTSHICHLSDRSTRGGSWTLRSERRSLPTVREVKDECDLEVDPLDWSCDGSRRFAAGSGEGGKTHEFILRCHISLLQSISRREHRHKPAPSIPGFTEGGSIRPLTEILGSVGPLLYDKRTQFATAVVLHTRTSVPECCQDTKTPRRRFEMWQKRLI